MQLIRKFWNSRSRIGKFFLVLICVTLSLAGYSLAVPGDDPVQNYTVDLVRAQLADGQLVPLSNDALGGRLPVVIVHGRLPGAFDDHLDPDELERDVVGPMLDQLSQSAEKDGKSLDSLFKFYAFTYDTSRSYDNVARDLSALIEGNRELTTGRKIAFVAHSYGSLVVRSYRTDLASSKAACPGLILLAGPNRGTPASVRPWLEETLKEVHPRSGELLYEKLSEEMGLSNASATDLWPSGGESIPDDWLQSHRNAGLARLNGRDDPGCYFAYGSHIQDYRGGRGGALLDMLSAAGSLLRDKSDDRPFYRVSGYVLAHMAEHPPLENDGLVPLYSSLMLPLSVYRRRKFEDTDHSQMFARVPRVADRVFEDLMLIQAQLQDEPGEVLEFDFPPISDFRFRMGNDPSLTDVRAVWVSDKGQLKGLESPDSIISFPSFPTEVRHPSWNSKGSELLLSVKSDPPWVALASESEIDLLFSGELAAFGEEDEIFFRYRDMLLAMESNSNDGRILLNSGADDLTQPPVVVGDDIYLVADEHLYRMSENDQLSGITQAELLENRVISVAEAGDQVFSLSRISSSHYRLRALAWYNPFSIEVELSDSVNYSGDLSELDLELNLPDLAGVEIDWENQEFYFYSSDLTSSIVRVDLSAFSRTVGDNLREWSQDVQQGRLPSKPSGPAVSQVIQKLDTGGQLDLKP